MKRNSAAVAQKTRVENVLNEMAGEHARTMREYAVLDADHARLDAACRAYADANMKLQQDSYNRRKAMAAITKAIAAEGAERLRLVAQATEAVDAVNNYDDRQHLSEMLRALVPPAPATEPTITDKINAAVAKADRTVGPMKLMVLADASDLAHEAKERGEIAPEQYQAVLARIVAAAK